MDHPQQGRAIDPDVIATLKELGGIDDPNLYVEVIDLFLQDAGPHVENLRKALESADVKLLERTAHTLKSASANVGAVGFSKLCFEIEQRGRAARIDGLDALVELATRQFAAVCAELEQLKS